MIRFPMNPSQTPAGTAIFPNRFATAKAVDMPVFISPHYYYPHDHRWQFEGALEALMQPEGYQYQSDFAKKYFGEGKAEGMVEAKVGSVLAVLTAPFILCTLGLGLLVSTLARTQQQAMMISTFVFMMPQIYLSGFVFPIQNMPVIFQWITYAIPLRYYVTVLRGVFLKGVGLETLWPQALAMLGLGTAILIVARLRFRQRVG